MTRLLGIILMKSTEFKMESKIDSCFLSAGVPPLGPSPVNKKSNNK